MDWQFSVQQGLRCTVILQVNHTRAYQDRSPATSQASGFFIYRLEEEGLGVLLTNRHSATLGPCTIYASFEKHEQVKCDVLYSDPLHDFAFYVFDLQQLRRTKLGRPLPLNAAGLQVGVDVKIVGNDDEERNQILSGTVAKINRNPPCLGDYDQDLHTFYALAASSTSCGSSGSPVLNIAGEAIALNTAAANTGSGSYYLPLGKVVEVFKYLIKLYDHETCRVKSINSQNLGIENKSNPDEDHETSDKPWHRKPIAELLSDAPPKRGTLDCIFNWEAIEEAAINCGLDRAVNLTAGNLTAAAFRPADDRAPIPKNRDYKAGGNFFVSGASSSSSGSATTTGATDHSGAAASPSAELPAVMEPSRATPMGSFFSPGGAAGAAHAGVLVVEEVLPKSPASDLLQAGDALVELDGINMVDQGLDAFQVLESILDAKVGTAVEMAVCRSGRLVNVTLPVEDLFSRCIPSVLLEFGLGCFHDVAQAVAFRHHIAQKGVYVAKPGHLFAQLFDAETGGIIREINGIACDTVDQFEHRMANIPDGDRFLVSYITFDSGGTRNFRELVCGPMSRQWQQPVVWERQGHTGGSNWVCRDALGTSAPTERDHHVAPNRSAAVEASGAVVKRGRSPLVSSKVGPKPPLRNGALQCRNRKRLPAVPLRDAEDASDSEDSGSDIDGEGRGLGSLCSTDGSNYCAGKVNNVSSPSGIDAQRQIDESDARILRDAFRDTLAVVEWKIPPEMAVGHTEFACAHRRGIGIAVPPGNVFLCPRTVVPQAIASVTVQLLAPEGAQHSSHSKKQLFEAVVDFVHPTQNFSLVRILPPGASRTISGGEPSLSIADKRKLYGSDAKCSESTECDVLAWNRNTLTDHANQKGAGKEVKMMPPLRPAAFQSEEWNASSEMSKNVRKYLNLDSPPEGSTGACLAFAPASAGSIRSSDSATKNAVAGKAGSSAGSLVADGSKLKAADGIQGEDAVLVTVTDDLQIVPTRNFEFLCSQPTVLENVWTHPPRWRARNTLVTPLDCGQDFLGGVVVSLSQFRAAAEEVHSLRQHSGARKASPEGHKMNHKSMKASRNKHDVSRSKKRKLDVDTIVDGEKQGESKALTNDTLLRNNTTGSVSGNYKLRMFNDRAGTAQGSSLSSDELLWNFTEALPLVSAVVFPFPYVSSETAEGPVEHADMEENEDGEQSRTASGLASNGFPDTVGVDYLAIPVKQFIGWISSPDEKYEQLGTPERDRICGLHGGACDVSGSNSMTPQCERAREWPDAAPRGPSLARNSSDSSDSRASSGSSTKPHLAMKSSLPEPASRDCIPARARVGETNEKLLRSADSEVVARALASSSSRPCIRSGGLGVDRPAASKCMALGESPSSRAPDLQPRDGSSAASSTAAHELLSYNSRHLRLLPYATRYCVPVLDVELCAFEAATLEDWPEKLRPPASFFSRHKASSALKVCSGASRAENSDAAEYPQTGDIMVKLQSRNFRSVIDLENALWSTKKKTLTETGLRADVYRKGVLRRVLLQPEFRKSDGAERMVIFHGLVVVESPFYVPRVSFGKPNPGLYVVRTKPGTPASASLGHVGDLFVIQVDGVPVNTLAELQQLARNDGNAQVNVKQKVVRALLRDLDGRQRLAIMWIDPVFWPCQEYSVNRDTGGPKITLW
ncbi:unnamed protein product [Amoebophrya sp. A120]|nr:unnamed protein product [Amoebophrya sp. A120]|eukprot:GSA120T00015297001.1